MLKNLIFGALVLVGLCGTASQAQAHYPYGGYGRGYYGGYRPYYGPRYYAPPYRAYGYPGYAPYYAPRYYAPPVYAYPAPVYYGPRVGVNYYTPRVGVSVGF